MGKTIKLSENTKIYKGKKGFTSTWSKPGNSGSKGTYRQISKTKRSK